MNGEHSLVDAPTTNEIFKYITQHVGADGALPLDAALQPLTPEQNAALPSPRPIRWELPDSVRDAIEESAAEADAISADLQITLLKYEPLTRGALKARRVSPDTAVQMAIQLAYALMHGKSAVATYETASARLFRYGRTETVR